MVRVRSLARERAANPMAPSPYADRHILRGILYQLGLQVVILHIAHAHTSLRILTV